MDEEATQEDFLWERASIPNVSFWIFESFYGGQLSLRKEVFI